MKLDQIHYFVAASQTQHIGMAARKLGISPSAISHSIRNLEEILGNPLFKKIGKNIYLTDFGRRFSERAKILLEDANKLKIEFQSPDLPIEGVLRVGVTHGVGNMLLAPLLAQIQMKHPQLIFEALSLRSAEVLTMVANGELDVGICFSPNPHPLVSVLRKVLVPLKIAVAAKHPILRAKPAKLIQMISDLPSTSPKAFAGIEVCEDHPELKRLGIRSRVGLWSDSYEISAEYIKKNSGWIFMPEVLIKTLGLKVLPVPGLKANASLALIVPKGRTLPPALINGLWNFGD